MKTVEIDEKTLQLAQQFGLQADEACLFLEKLGRAPSIDELAVCGALWSEHCSYKSSRVHLKRFHTQEPWVIQGPGENAGVVAITPDYGVAFKMESHNHPSYIEPYQGAATGVGGILRDVFCMGAVPVANLNCLRFGEGTWNAKLLRHTVRGIGDYGNAMGVPTVGGDLSFHDGYSQNILVNAFCAGLVHKDRLYKGIVSNEAGARPNTTPIPIGAVIRPGSSLEQALMPTGENLLVYFGSATGRDGVHGATMSSAAFSATAETLKPTVQVGDPFAEKMLLEATLSLIEKQLTVGLQDMGAAGLTSSSVEMAGRSGCGVFLDLNMVPKRASNMQSWEILLSESQERMLCAVTPENLQPVLQELERFQLSAAVIGKVNRTGLFTCAYDGYVVTATPIDLLVDEAPRYEWPLQDREAYLKEHASLKNTTKEPQYTPEQLSLDKAAQKEAQSLSLSLQGEDTQAHQAILQGISLNQFHQQFAGVLPRLWAHPAFGSREPLVQHYCSTVQGNTVSGCGTFFQAAASVVRLPHWAQEPSKLVGLALAAGCEERWVTLDPFQGAALTALKVARKIVAAGGKPLAMTDCLNFGSPRIPSVMRQLSDAIDGINDVAKRMHIPIVSGNVSLNNQTEGHPIPPTPMIGMVGRIDDVSHIPWAQLPHTHFNSTTPGTDPDVVTLMHLTHPAFKPGYEASLSSWILGASNSQCPPVFIEQEKNLWELLSVILVFFNPTLCYPVGHGGLLGALALCALKSSCGLALHTSVWEGSMKPLLAEGQAGFVLGLPANQASALAEWAANQEGHSTDFTLKPVGQLVPTEASAPTGGAYRYWDLTAAGVGYGNSLLRFWGV